MLGETVTIDSDKVIILEDSFMQSEQDDFLLPQSRLVGMDMAVSNLCAAMEADNVLLKKRGALGFISHDAAAVKDSVTGYLPMEDEEKQELQKELQQYGLSLRQFQYAISRTAVKWNPISFNVKELATKETIVACEEAICHRYNFPFVLYKETDATFANQSEAGVSVYQNNIIPNANKDMQKYSKFFKCSENNVLLVINFEHVAALQEDKAEAAAAQKALTEYVQAQYDGNWITKNAGLTLLGYDTVPDGDVYKKDEVTNEPTNEDTTLGNSLFA